MIIFKGISKDPHLMLKFAGANNGLVGVCNPTRIIAVAYVTAAYAAAHKIPSY